MSSAIRRSVLRRTISKGYTLIEVLVAMAIFTSMVLLASMALNQGLRQYQGLMDKGLNFWDHARYVWLDRSFNSAIDYYIRDTENIWTPYFIGKSDIISYVSAAPLSGDLPVVVWIKNEREGNGKSSLVYYELPVYTKTYKDIDREYTFGDYKKGNSIKLLEGVEDMKVSSYGYDPVRRSYSWYEDYDARKVRMLPEVVRISFSKEGNQGKLFFSLNVNSTIKMSYNETY